MVYQYKDDYTEAHLYFMDFYKKMSVFNNLVGHFEFREYFTFCGRTNRIIILNNRMKTIYVPFYSGNVKVILVPNNE